MSPEEFSSNNYNDGHHNNKIKEDVLLLLLLLLYLIYYSEHQDDAVRRLPAGQAQMMGSHFYAFVLTVCTKLDDGHVLPVSRARTCALLEFIWLGTHAFYLCDCILSSWNFCTFNALCLEPARCGTLARLHSHRSFL